MRHGRPEIKQIKFIVLILVIASISCNFPLLQPRPTPPILPHTVTPTAAQTPFVTALPTVTETLSDSLPSGKIVFVCLIDGIDQICLMNADGRNDRQLTSEPATSFYPSLSPDGDRIVFSSRRDGNFEIFEMDTIGSRLFQLTNDIGSLYAPEISPDGSKIVFTNHTDGRQHIWLMDRDGQDPHPLTSGSWDDLDPTWSPDGSQIAFASNRDGSTQLFTMNVDGSNVRQITRDIDAIGGRNSWSPDGRFLAYYAGSRAQSDRNLFLVDLASSTVLQVTQGGDNLGPSFSLDGEWLAFTSYRSGNNDIWIIRRDGSQSVQLTYGLRADWQPRWGP